MNILKIYTLKLFRNIYTKCFVFKPLPILDIDINFEKSYKIIYDLLSNDKPCMIARFGSTELLTLVNYIGVKGKDKNYVKYIKGQSLDWWWNRKIIEQMQQWSGFFPPTQENIDKFCELMLVDMGYVDILGSWLQNEKYFTNDLKDSKFVDLICLEPYFSTNPWTKALHEKKILVIHPFADSIRSQFKKRKLLFKNSEILPDFKSFEVIQSVQSLGGIDNGFSDWFEALNYMKSEIDKKDYDICLIGCGAYGFPLAAHVKRQGKKSIHLGGSLQLLFGIKGARWDKIRGELYNEYWIRPSDSEKPKTANLVEDGCYW